MGLFGRKNTHRKEVEAAFRVLGNLFTKTIEGREDTPAVLKFELPDSHMRYWIFCLSTMQTACANRMRNPDAVLNEIAHTSVTAALTDQAETFFGGPVVDPQAVATQEATRLQDFLHRWSAYVDIVSGDNQAAGTSIVLGMIRETESSAEATETDVLRLLPLAAWIEGALEAMGNGFESLAK